MRILLTGGAGFIASHLTEKLLSAGHYVIGMDNLITGRMENIAGVMNDPNFEFIKHDVSNYIDVKGELDYVLHMASPASPVDYLEHPIKTLKVGSLGTHNSLGVAKEHGAKFLLASTSEVYGDPLVNPQPETYWGNVNPVGPRGVYDESKRFAEAITLAYHRTHGIDTKIVRIFNTFGERMRHQDGRVVPNFIDQALNNEPLTVYGDGSQTRSFCYVSDLVAGLIKLMDSALNEPVNIGNPEEMSILEFAQKIIKMTKSKSEIVYEELPVNDPKVRRPDIAKAKKELDWEPVVSLEEGLNRTIGWFKKEAEADL
ncbi:MAG: SDR family oxidoreductase [Candidatus Omnitrophica bacterium]|nr:SDR family oxidoreductase [Candidatus Omnitrophota bacterium]MBU1127988.1 SDR family oxidoreductase [Candidatus Omnitrophota bacterium]MBU1657224.1 SDR family oxidoreductase [Candidatus Omnitrophota bacterium]MBU1783860.1 SDR family oxidoreductase [Candidatus Omnitrophota bacterium]MBU1851496.1 SDR family oxidoreductase [Candidatus Omnitrophota bacterium]